MNIEKTDLEELVSDFAKGSRHRPKPRGRKNENQFVCKKSIDFTADMWAIITNRIHQTQGNPRMVIYESLELLAEKYNDEKE